MLETKHPQQLPAVVRHQSKNAALADQQAKAKELYFQYSSLHEISKQLSVSIAQLSRWRKEGGWLIERESLERGIIEDGFSRRKLTVARIMNVTTEQLERALKFISERQAPPTLPEAEKLSMILSNLDKIGRLDTGKATENLAVAAKLEMTAEDIRKIILSDPARAFEEPVTDASK
jgi:hypothetical protein